MTQNTLPASEDARLRGRWLTVARVAWVAIALADLVLFVASIPAYWGQLNTVCTDPSGATCNFPQLNPVKLQAVERLGATIGAYAAYTLTIHVAASLAFFIVGTLIFWRRSGDWYGLFVSLLLISFGTIGPSAVFSSALTWVYPEIAPLDDAQTLIFPALGLFLVTFPDGRFVPRWSWALVLLWVVQAVFWGLIDRLPPPLFVAEVLLVWGSTLAVQIYRYRRVGNATQRQQTKWVLFGFALGVSTIVIGGLLALAFPQFNEPDSRFWLLEGTWVTLLFTPLPLSIGVALLRYRLWDIDPIINRSLVYGALTVSVVGIYILVVGYLGALFQTGGNLFISLVATGLVAILFAPLRERLQRGVNRLMYGERDEPYKVLSRLGRRLEGTLAPEAVLPTIVENIARTLRLPHVAIWLADGEALRLGAAHGDAPARTVVWDSGAVESLRRASDGLHLAELTPSGEYGAVLDECGVVLVLPMTHQGELVGALCMSPRSPGETFSPADRQLLRDLATQAGAAAHAVRLTVALRSSLEELRQSRKRLVAAQEEERRRIQRDLHDGLGPVLASMRLRLEACLDVAQETKDPLTSDLERLYELVGQTTADVRRLVYNLRPPVLDQLGLVSAVKQHCERFSRETGIEVSFEAEENLSIPAAAEAALLRVVQEALLNVGKHAHATRVEVRLGRRDEWLVLEVRDEGVGFEANVHLDRKGTGIGSMRERVELLGGTLQLTGRPGVGTEVEACIPPPEVSG